MKNKFLSIVIPVYNVEKYLIKCVESILTNLKKYQNHYEILLINDGSKDSSGEICDNLSKKHEGIIRAFHKENGGASSARNYGIKQVVGEFVMFVDADDYVDNNIERAFDEIIEHKDECDVFEFNLIFHEYKKIKFLSMDSGIYSLLNYSDCKKVILPNTKRNGSVLRTYNLKFLIENNLFFKLGTLEEDYNLVPKIWLKAKKIFVSNIRYYHYIMYREGSTTSNIKKKYFTDLIQSSVENYDLVEKSKMDKKIQKLIKGYICFNVLAIMRKINKLAIEEKNEIIDLLLQNNKIIKYPPTWQTKMFMFFAKIFGIKFALKLV